MFNHLIKKDEDWVLRFKKGELKWTRLAQSVAILSSQTSVLAKDIARIVTMKVVIQQA